MPGAFGAPYIPGGAQDRVDRAPTLYDDPDCFMFWQESFRLCISRVGGNLEWTLILNDGQRAFRVAGLSLSAVQQYLDQEQMWQWLHEACKYSDKAQSIITHAMMNKAQPQFATMAWKAIMLRFNPATPANKRAREADLKKKIKSFNGEWREWMQDVLHCYTLLIEAGMQTPESEMVKHVLQAVGAYTAGDGKKTSSKQRIWEDFMKSAGRLPEPHTLQQLNSVAEQIETDAVFIETYQPEPDPASDKYDILARAYASIIAREVAGGDSSLQPLSNTHVC